MTITQAVYEYLVLQSAVTALVGTRIYPLYSQLAPADVGKGNDVDYIAYSIDAMDPMHGFANGATAAYARLEIFCNSTYDVGNAVALAAVVRAALDFQNGAWGTASPSDTVTVRSCLLEDESQGTDMDSGIFFVSQIYQLIFDL